MPVDLASFLIAAAETPADTPPSEPPGLGAIVLAVAGVAVLVWMLYLVNARRRKARAEETPKNLQQYLSDDELESNRLTRVLGSAVVASAILALTLPIYFFNEPGRQEAAADDFDHLYVEEGEHWYTAFTCIECHGPEGVGGAAAFTEARSGLDTAWTAPSLNDVFYRYSEDEVRFWIVYGRSGTPMPAAGLEGGGSMTEQEVDQTIAYLRSIQIPQADVLAEVDPAVNQALSRYDNALDNVIVRLDNQQEVRQEILDAPDLATRIGTFPAQIIETLSGPGTCTRESAALIQDSCAQPGADADRDGLSDAAEAILTDISTRISGILDNQSLLFTFDTTTAFTNTVQGEMIDDLEAADELRIMVDEEELGLRVTAERQDVFLAAAEASLDFLEESLAERRWEIDLRQLANDEFGGDFETARRALGLYNSQCARCHTAGYSAGVAFEQEPGSGAWGPALNDGRAVVQFPDIEDHISFIIGGSELAENYGVNGLGRGWMPGFGQSLTREDIELIVRFERWL